jgi:hypothetical protein
LEKLSEEIIEDVPEILEFHQNSPKSKENPIFSKSPQISKPNKSSSANFTKLNDEDAKKQEKNRKSVPRDREIVKSIETETKNLNILTKMKILLLNKINK